MIASIADKPSRLVVGMMSGTSVDGVDAALVRIGTRDGEMNVEQLAFQNKPFPPAVREKIFELFDPEKATVRKIGYMNFLLGEIYAQAAREVARAAGVRIEDVDVIGSHGQTIWHEPVPAAPDGIPVSYTVQIGEGAVIAERTGVVTVSDFRVADVAAGGQGAPLVPFTEFLLYRRQHETILLQNIGGIGNVTILPAGAKPEDVFAFDTGPGNMIMRWYPLSHTERRRTMRAADWPRRERSAGSFLPGCRRTPTMRSRCPRRRGVSTLARSTPRRFSRGRKLTACRTRTSWLQ